jgi:hypothetical protein
LGSLLTTKVVRLSLAHSLEIGSSAQDLSPDSLSVSSNVHDDECELQSVVSKFRTRGHMTIDHNKAEETQNQHLLKSKGHTIAG